MSILNVALACGFVSASHFSKCYREFFNKMPREERQEAGRGPAAAESMPTQRSEVTDLQAGPLTTGGGSTCQRSDLEQLRVEWNRQRRSLDPVDRKSVGEGKRGSGRGDI